MAPSPIPSEPLPSARGRVQVGRVACTCALAMLIFSSVSMFTVYPLMGQPYGHEDICAAALMVATTMSFLTISTLLLIL